MARRNWSVQDAKNRFSEVVEAARREPQTVTKHGKPAVVVVAVDEYERLRKLQRLKAPSFSRDAHRRRGIRAPRGANAGTGILMYLLDTVVLSELRKAPRQRNRNLVHWIGEVPSQDLFVSVLTVGEIKRGIERQRQLNPEFADRIASWLDMILRTYERRILAVDVAVARRWGRLSYLISNKGIDLAMSVSPQLVLFEIDSVSIAPIEFELIHYGPFT